MNSTVTRRWRALGGLVLLLALAAATTLAQQPSPSPQPDADAQTQSSTTQNGDEGGDYTITSSIEIGYRGLRVNGDVNKYQSDLNYKAGPRLFDTSFLMQGKEGTGALLDNLLVTTTGWGSDPNGHLRVNAENSDWFRLDGNFRRFKYFRDLNNIVNPQYLAAGARKTSATGDHDYDNRQQVGDLDLTILPKNDRIRFNVGYSPTSFTGPFYTTYRGGGGDELPIVSRSDWRSDDFRVGADWKLGPIDFSFAQGFRRFRDDTYVDNDYLNLGNSTASNSFFLTSIERRNPIRGEVNYTRFSGHTLLGRKLDLTGRFIYSNATTEYTFTDRLTGGNFNSRWPGTTTNTSPYNPAPSSGPPNPTTLTLGLWEFVGDTKRPNTLADFGVTYFATDRLRFSNTFRVETFQLNGGAFYNGRFEITQNRTNTALPAFTATGYSYDVTKYRRVQNTVEGDFEINDRYSVRFGYRYGSRWLEKISAGHNLGSLNAPAWDSGALEHRNFEEEYDSHAFFGGVKARPVKDWVVSFDLERGTADGIFTRTGIYDYTNVRARSRYTVNRNLRFNLAFITKDNATPDQLVHHGQILPYDDFGVEYKSRVFTSSVDWTVNPRLSFSGGYNYNWVNSDAVVKYSYLGLCTQQNCFEGRSQYFIRNHYFNFDVVAQPFRRVTFYAAYRINKDTGQGDLPTAPLTGILTSSYPFSYQSPEARVAFRINRRIDWNVGYQYYNYNESTLAGGNYLPHRPQNYNAHLPYTSLRFYFGRGEQ